MGLRTWVAPTTAAAMQLAGFLTLLPTQVLADQACDAQDKVLEKYKVKDGEKPDLTKEGIQQVDGKYRSGAEKDSPCVDEDRLSQEIEKSFKAKHETADRTQVVEDLKKSLPAGAQHPGIDRLDARQARFLAQLVKHPELQSTVQSSERFAQLVGLVGNIDHRTQRLDELARFYENQARPQATPTTLGHREVSERENTLWSHWSSHRSHVAAAFAQHRESGARFGEPPAPSFTGLLASVHSEGELVRAIESPQAQAKMAEWLKTKDPAEIAKFKETLLTMASFRNPETSANALRLLGALHDKSLVPLFLSKLDERNGQAQVSARALGSIIGTLKKEGTGADWSEYVQNAGPILAKLSTARIDDHEINKVLADAMGQAKLMNEEQRTALAAHFENPAAVFRMLTAASYQGIAAGEAIDAFYKQFKKVAGDKPLSDFLRLDGGRNTDTAIRILSQLRERNLLGDEFKNNPEFAKNVATAILSDSRYFRAGEAFLRDESMLPFLLEQIARSSSNRPDPYDRRRYNDPYDERQRVELASRIIGQTLAGWTPEQFAEKAPAILSKLAEYGASNPDLGITLGDSMRKFDGLSADQKKAFLERLPDASAAMKLMAAATSGRQLSPETVGLLYGRFQQLNGGAPLSDLIKKAAASNSYGEKSAMLRFITQLRQANQLEAELAKDPDLQANLARMVLSDRELAYRGGTEFLRHESLLPVLFEGLNGPARDAAARAIGSIMAGYRSEATGGSPEKFIEKAPELLKKLATFRGTDDINQTISDTLSQFNLLNAAQKKAFAEKFDDPKTVFQMLSLAGESRRGTYGNLNTESVTALHAQLRALTQDKKLSDVLDTASYEGKLATIRFMNTLKTHDLLGQEMQRDPDLIKNFARIALSGDRDLGHYAQHFLRDEALLPILVEHLNSPKRYSQDVALRAIHGILDGYGQKLQDGRPEEFLQKVPGILEAVTKAGLTNYRSIDLIMTALHNLNDNRITAQMKTAFAQKFTEPSVLLSLLGASSSRDEVDARRGLHTDTATILFNQFKRVTAGRKLSDFLKFDQPGDRYLATRVLTRLNRYGVLGPELQSDPALAKLVATHMFTSETARELPVEEAFALAKLALRYHGQAVGNELLDKIKNDRRDGSFNATSALLYLGLHPDLLPADLQPKLREQLTRLPEAVRKGIDDRAKTPFYEAWPRTGPIKASLVMSQADHAFQFMGTLRSQGYSSTQLPREENGQVQRFVMKKSVPGGQPIELHVDILPSNHDGWVLDKNLLNDRLKKRYEDTTFNVVGYRGHTGEYNYRTLSQVQRNNVFVYDLSCGSSHHVNDWVRGCTDCGHMSTVAVGEGRVNNIVLGNLLESLSKRETYPQIQHRIIRALPPAEAARYTGSHSLVEFWSRNARYQLAPMVAAPGVPEIGRVVPVPVQGLERQPRNRR
ncbi:MAG: hypothetical protein HY078_09735 [Elusimicrobia bacterium]|nr:hypothetical protein [Elusimicrobiota bacterium]